MRKQVVNTRAKKHDNILGQVAKAVAMLYQKYNKLTIGVNNVYQSGIVIEESAGLKR